MRQQLDMGANDPGVVVLSVDPESDAAEEGINVRQIVVGIDDKPIATVADWNRIVRDLKPGETVKVELRQSPRTTEFVFLTVPPRSK
jgi:S1-C subfamily serine protease